MAIFSSQAGAPWRRASERAVASCPCEVDCTAMRVLLRREETPAPPNTCPPLISSQTRPRASTGLARRVRLGGRSGGGRPEASSSRRRVGCHSQPRSRYRGDRGGNRLRALPGCNPKPEYVAIGLPEAQAMLGCRNDERRCGLLNHFVVTVQGMDHAQPLRQGAAKRAGMVERARLFDGGGRRLHCVAREALDPQDTGLQDITGDMLIQAEAKSLRRPVTFIPPQGGLDSRRASACCPRKCRDTPAIR